MQNQDGRTALMLAAQKGHKKIVTTLLEDGAAIDAQDKHGKTALQWAQDQGHGDIASILESAMKLAAEKSFSPRPGAR